MWNKISDGQPFTFKKQGCQSNSYIKIATWWHVHYNRRTASGVCAFIQKSIKFSDYSIRQTTGKQENANKNLPTYLYSLFYMLLFYMREAAIKRNNLRYRHCSCAPIMKQNAGPRWDCELSKSNSGTSCQ